MVETGNGLFNTLNYELLNKKENIIINVFHVLTTTKAPNTIFP